NLPIFGIVYQLDYAGSLSMVIRVIAVLQKIFAGVVAVLSITAGCFHRRDTRIAVVTAFADWVDEVFLAFFIYLSHGVTVVGGVFMNGSAKKGKHAAFVFVYENYAFIEVG